ncbi:MAG: YIP1 family protein [Desulfobacteraceae bacterium]|nr:YIP1 family protein [Desulfobacteraceae bacterium]
MKQVSGQFFVVFYFQALAKVLGTPVIFFRELQDIDFKQSLGFLVVSSVFFAGASLLTRQFVQPLLSGGILFINAIGMTFIAAGLGYMLMSMFFGKKVTFPRLFAVYAFSAGVTLLASWIPLFVWLTEPWKWVLIGLGLTKSCDFRWNQTIVVIGGSIGIMILFFKSLLPLIS